MSGGILNASDWSTAANWSSASKPVNDDDTVIPNTLNDNVTMSADESDLDVDLLHVQKGFTGTFGTSASPLVFAADLIKVFGSSGFYMEVGDGTTSSGITDEIRLQMRTPNTPVELGKEAAASLGQFERIICERGLITLKGNVNFTATAVVEVGYMNDQAGDVRVIIGSGADTLPNLRMNGGRVTSDGAITTATVCNGILTQDTAAVTTVFVYRGGRLELNGSGTVATTVVIYDGGWLDLLQTSFQKTITTLYLFPGANIIWDQNLSGSPGLHTITNPFDMRNAD